MLITRCLQTPQPQRCGPQLGDNLPVAIEAIEVRLKISELSYLFLFAMASDGENIARERCLSFRIIEMDDRAVVFDQVDFLNAGNIIYCELLQSRLQFLVVGCGCLVDDLLLATWGTCRGKPVLVSLVQGAWLFIHFPRIPILISVFCIFHRHFALFRPKGLPFPPIRTSSAWACNFFNFSGFISLEFLDFFWRSRAFNSHEETKKV